MSKQGFTVPIFIDENRNGLIRAQYFVIENMGSNTPWMLGVNGTQIPFFLIELQGVIFRSFSQDGNFNRPDDFFELFEAIELFNEEEKEYSTFTTLNSIYLPEFIFDIKEKVYRNNVFRMDFDLFRKIYSINLSKNQKQLAEFLKETESRAFYSNEESFAFRAWCEFQYNISLDNNKGEEFKLPKKQ